MILRLLSDALNKLESDYDYVKFSNTWNNIFDRVEKMKDNDRRFFTDILEIALDRADTIMKLTNTKEAN